MVTQNGTNNFVISIYTPLTGSLAASPSTAEIGSTVSSIGLTWSYNNSVTSQSINQSIGSLPIGQRAYTYSTPTSSNITFTLTGTDGRTTVTPNASLSFLRKRYWGTIPSVPGGMPSNAQILAANSELTTSRAKTISYDCSTPVGGNHWWYAYPTSLGLSTVTINGLPFSDWYNPTNPSVSTVSPTSISLTNAYGHVESYYLYRVYNVQNGSNIQVTFA